jgi:hypothetical protein
MRRDSLDVIVRDVPIATASDERFAEFTAKPGVNPIISRRYARSSGGAAVGVCLEGHGRSP